MENGYLSNPDLEAEIQEACVCGAKGFGFEKIYPKALNIGDPSIFKKTLIRLTTKDMYALDFLCSMLGKNQEEMLEKILTEAVNESVAGAMK